MECCYILDRFEENLAVIEAAGEQDEIRYLTVERSLLPKDAAQGDVLEKTKEGWWINHQETERRRRRIQMLLQNLNKGKPHQ